MPHDERPAPATPHDAASVVRARLTELGHGALPEAVLVRLLETAFYATLTDDEGRPTVFRLVMREPGAGLPDGWLGLGVEAQPLAVEAVRLLAPAARAAGPEAAIEVVDDDGLLRVAGIAVWAGADAGVPEWPGLAVEGRGRGVLDVAYGETRLASLVRGALRRYDQHLEQPALLAAIAARVPDVAGTAPYAALRVLLRVADALADGDHGGTLLVVPSGPYARVPTLRPTPRYAIAAAATGLLADALATFRDRNGRVARAGRRAEFDEVDFDAWVGERARDRAARRALEQAIQLVAGLAAVDGAVVMTADLHLLAFGAMIDAVPEHEAAVTTVDPAAPGERHLRAPLSFGGARHQSAIAFCQRQPGGALAFVASQDGTLTLFVRTADGVAALQPLDLSAIRAV